MAKIEKVLEKMSKIEFNCSSLKNNFKFKQCEPINKIFKAFNLNKNIRRLKYLTLRFLIKKALYLNLIFLINFASIGFIKAEF